MKLFTILAVLFILVAPVSGQDATVTTNVAGADQAATLNLNGYGTAAVQVTGTWTATLTFEATVDGTNWFTINVFKVSDFTAVTTTAANGQWMTGVAGYRSVRARASAYTSGTAVVTIRAAEQAQPIPVSVSTPAPPSTVTITNDPLDVNVLSLPGGGGLTDAELRAAPVPVSATALTSLDGKFPAAAALADATANPTLTKIQTFQMAWNFDTAIWNRQVQYADGDSSITKVGTLLMGENGGGIIRTVRVHDDGGLVVNQGTANSSPWGMYIASPDGSQAATVTAADGLQVFSTDFDIRNLAFATDKVDITGSSVTVSASALPAGAATAANQATEITSLSSIDGKLPTTAAITDDTANPTLTKIQNFNMTWDAASSNWDRFTTVKTLGTATGTETLVAVAGVHNTTNFWGPLQQATAEPSSVGLGLVTRQVGMPAAAALADNTANPTLTKIQTFTMKWDSGGANWDRWDGSVTATNLDIHDLAFATDKVDVTGSVVDSNTRDGFGNQIQSRVADPDGSERGMVVRIPPGANVIGGVTQSGNWPVRLQDGSGLSLESTTSPAGGRGLDIHTGFGDGAAYSGAEPVFPIVGFYNGATQYRIPFVADAAPGASDTALVVRQVGMPAAAALADNTANPTLTKIQTFQMKWDSAGSNWDRWDGGVAQVGTWTVQPGNTANTTPWLVKQQRMATPATANVAASATNVTCLASNANRLAAALYNDSTADLMVKLGATASATSFTVKVFADGYFPIPEGYTGIVDCIWSSATGAARTTELTQ